MKILWSAVILLHCICGGYSQASPCDRPCNSKTKPMICVFYLVVDVYYTNQPDCANCSRGVESDCSRPFCIPGDGRFRMVKAYNYSIPGPTINVCSKDTVIVKVKNDLKTETTTVHWHGIHQVGTPDMDGVPMVTQRPIMPNECYIYKFEASPPGTHWYHSHSGSQKADGLIGKLIVRHYEKPQLVAYDHDIHSMILLEWFPILSEDIFMRYKRAGVSFGTEPERTILIDRHGHTTNKTQVPPTKYVVKQGRRYRFRLIHAGNMACPMEISIDNHRLLAFSSDGHNFKPVQVDSITLTNGERYDFVLHANKPISQYVIRIISYMACGVNAYAILEYEGAQKIPINYNHRPTLQRRLNCVANRTPGCIYYSQLEHVPRECRSLDLFSTPHVVSLYFDLYKIAHDKYKGTVAAPNLLTPFINKIGFIPPKKTFLCNRPQKTCNENTVKSEFKQCPHLIEIPFDEMIEIVLIDEGTLLALTHPFHLHGYSFMVMSYGWLGANTTRNEVMALYNNKQLSRSNHPILKDTVTVPDGGFVVIRFRADNPGYWLLHCHVNSHSEDGMQLVLKTSEVPKPPKSCKCIV